MPLLPLTCAVPEYLKLWQDNMKGFIKREKKPPPFLNSLIQKFLNENCLVFGPETAHSIKYIGTYNEYQKLRHICAYYLN